MRGLVLEGGGAKGAFHLGAVKALYDNGYTFDGVSGTSIGAINGSIIAQECGYELLYDLWASIKPSDITDFDNEMVERLQNKDYGKENVVYWMKQAISVIKNYGVPTDKVIPFLKNYVDEDKLRQSKMDFALVTYCVTDRKPLELFKEDIPQGSLLEYIFASAYYPAFRLQRLNGKLYLDGGLYDNLPLNILARKGYDELFAIRTMSRMPHSKIIDSSVTVNYICPSEDLGGTTELNPKLINYNISLGYHDGMRFVNRYLGEKYYIKHSKFDSYESLMLNLDDEAYQNIKTLLELPSDLPKEAVVTNIFAYLKSLCYDKTHSRKLAFIYFLEPYAKLYGVEKFMVYSIEEFYFELVRKFRSHNDNGAINGLNKNRLFITQKTKQQLILQEIMNFMGDI